MCGKEDVMLKFPLVCLFCRICSYSLALLCKEVLPGGSVPVTSTGYSHPWQSPDPSHSRDHP